MSEICTCRISLEEIAEKAGHLPLAAVVSNAARLGIGTGEDWAGRPSVSVRDAGALYAAVTGSTEENRLANQERIRAEDDATAARDAAERKVFNDAYNDGMRRGVSGPRAYAKAVEAVSHAREVGTIKKIAEAAKKLVGV